MNGLRQIQQANDAAMQTARLRNALKVLVLDAKIRAWLEANDPKALEQAMRALGY
jgi:hypothetical protein